MPKRGSKYFPSATAIRNTLRRPCCLTTDQRFNRLIDALLLAPILFGDHRSVSKRTEPASLTLPKRHQRRPIDSLHLGPSEEELFYAHLRLRGAGTNQKLHALTRKSHHKARITPSKPPNASQNHRLRLFFGLRNDGPSVLLVNNRAYIGVRHCTRLRR